MPKNIFSKHYRKDLKRLYEFLTPEGAKTAIVKDGGIPRGKFDYIIFDDVIGDIKDVQALFGKARKRLRKKGKVVVSYYNHLWEPVLKLASFLGLRRKIDHEQNWLDTGDIKNLLNLAGFETITIQKRFLFPIPLPFISPLINKYIAPLPLINRLCLTTYAVARPVKHEAKEYPVSIIVPARNEEENIYKIPQSIPKFGKSQEIIFVEGGSKDNTWEKIKKETTKKQKEDVTVKAFKQKGEGKADAVFLGFEKATGDILMIYDADRTVEAKDLSKFYKALSEGVGEFANGSRLVYPMEKEAMRTLNKLANKIFSLLFTFILGQRFKDTLCGTKALFKKDYEKIKKEKLFKKMDPFGDFALIFGAIKNNLDVVEIPVRYKERDYGQTNIKRFAHGLLLLKMTLIAFREFKTS